MKQKYSFRKTVEKGSMQLAIFGLPLMVGYLTNLRPDIMSLSIGTLLNMLLNYLKNREK